MGLCHSTAAVDVEVSPGTGGSAKGGKGSSSKTGSTSTSGNNSNGTLYKPILGKTEDVKALYVFDKVLGKGQFGVTRLVRERSSGQQFACKTISKRKLVNPEDIEDVRREIKVGGKVDDALQLWRVDAEVDRGWWESGS
jgi:serine/threonine protein kinase